MKKLHEKIRMSNEASTAEERLEIVKLVKELGYEVFPGTKWDVVCYIIPGHVFTQCEKDYNGDQNEVTHQQMLDILANNEEDHSVVYKALGKVRSAERLPDVKETIKPLTIGEAVEQLHEVCRKHGITVKNLTFEMI